MQILMGKEVNVMGEFVEGLMAVMGITAGLMVALTTLLFGHAPNGVEGVSLIMIPVPFAQ
jgi:hypothetical protein